MKPHEEVKQRLVRQWLVKAEQDLEAADTLLSAEHPQETIDRPPRNPSKGGKNKLRFP